MASISSAAPAFKVTLSVPAAVTTLDTLMLAAAELVIEIAPEVVLVTPVTPPSAVTLIAPLVALFKKMPSVAVTAAKSVKPVVSILAPFVPMPSPARSKTSLSVVASAMTPPPSIILPPAAPSPFLSA